MAFNEQALLGRHRLNALAHDATILLENMWADPPGPERSGQEWEAAMEELSGRNYRIIEVPMEEQCLTVVDNPRKGKNMFALGMLCWIFDRDLERAKEQIAHAFRKKKPGDHRAERASSWSWATPGPRRTSTSATRSRPWRPTAPWS